VYPREITRKNGLDNSTGNGKIKINRLVVYNMIKKKIPGVTLVALDILK